MSSYVEVDRATEKVPRDDTTCAVTVVNVVAVHYFLDDHLFGNPRFARELFAGMTGMGRLWQAAGTVKSVLQPRLLEAAVESGLRSLFVGFETINAANLVEHDKRPSNASSNRVAYSIATGTVMTPGTRRSVQLA